MTSYALNSIDAHAQSSDSVVIVRAGEVWHNTSDNDYIALSHQRARALLAQSYALEVFDSLYTIEAWESRTLRSELREVKRVQRYERLAIVLLLILLIVK